MKDITFRVHQSIDAAWEDWSSFTKEDVFLSRSFHLAIEQSPPKGLMPLYVTVYHKDKSIGICYYQVKLIKISESLDLEKNNIRGFRAFLAKRLNFHGMVCGNAMVTGQYGYRFDKGLSRNDQFNIVAQATKEVQSWLKQEKQIKIGPILCKDYYKRQLYSGQQFEQFTQFSVQPMMQLVIDPSWRSFDDYLACMKTKYRTRAKRAVKKLGTIDTKEISLNELKNTTHIMHKLYMNVVNNAGFNLFILAEDYFYQLKKLLDDKIRIIGYYKQDVLVGFYTIILNNSCVDAHFLGYDKESNLQNHLYQNMLYDMIHRSIELGANKIFMSRTALEIKSSCGAKAEEMFCYIKHTNGILNAAIKPILNNLVPQEKWTPRSPFK